MASSATTASLFCLFWSALIMSVVRKNIHDHREDLALPSFSLLGWRRPIFFLDCLWSQPTSRTRQIRSTRNFRDQDRATFTKCAQGATLRPTPLDLTRPCTSHILWLRRPWCRFPETKKRQPVWHIHRPELTLTTVGLHIKYVKIDMSLFLAKSRW